MREVIKIIKMYGVREELRKRIDILEQLFKIKVEQELLIEYKILAARIHKLDDEILIAERNIGR